MAKEQVWLEYFNPCGGEAVPGYVIQTCVSDDCNRLPCLAKSAFQMAGFLLEKNRPIEMEKEDFARSLSQIMGRRVVTPTGETITLNHQAVAGVVESVADQAQKIVHGVNDCIANTTPITPEYMAGLPEEQRSAAEQVWQVNQRVNSFRGSQHEAILLAAEMREALKQAIDSGLGGLDIVVRQALVYGLADRIPEVDTTGKIIVGDPENLRPAPSGSRFR